MGNCSINICDGSELELAWSKKSSSYFENNSVGAGNIWIYFVSLFFSYYISYFISQVLFTLRVFLLLSPLDDACLDIANDNGSFQVSSEAEFTSPLSVHVTFATDTEEELSCCKQLLQVLKSC